MKKAKSRILSILFWSVISAAFIGPGTLTTASAAGSLFDFQLVWALAFATVSCIVLQEMTARITIVSGLEIGKILSRSRYTMVTYFIAFGIILGCAAYEAGNILGAIAGINLLFDINENLLTIFIGLVAGGLMFWGSVKTIVNILGVMVALMGLVFIYVSFTVEIDLGQLGRGLMPSIPTGAEWLVLGLIGTTIVPYNLFLGSGISRGQGIKQMRFGLTVSILLGGVVSIAILLTATQIDEALSFQVLAHVIGQKLGIWAQSLLGLGLFAAGFTSAITSPLAAALLIRSISGKHANQAYQYTWMGVLAVGLGFGLANVKPIPVIIMAQALNGLILPAVVVLLIILANDVKLLSKKLVNHLWLNILALMILDLVLLIGLNNIYKAVFTSINADLPDDISRLLQMQFIAIPVLVFTIGKVRKVRVG